MLLKVNAVISDTFYWNLLEIEIQVAGIYLRSKIIICDIRGQK